MWVLCTIEVKGKWPRMGEPNPIRVRVKFWGVMALWLLFTVTVFTGGYTKLSFDQLRGGAGSPVGGALATVGQRTQAVNDSYFAVFGRKPQKDEMTYWTSVPTNDPRVQSLDSLIRNHQAWLKSNAQEREATVQRAFQNVYGRNATGSQQQWYNSALSMAAQGTTYQELRRYLASAFIDSAYQHLLKRSAQAGDRTYWLNMWLDRGWSFEQVWTGIAQSQERLNNFKYWAPARTAYDGKYETCFGAIGSKCEGAPRNTPSWVDKFTRPDGTEMGYVNIQVSVGSILHDNACNRAGTGTMCNGLAKGIAIDAIPLANYLQAASLEWNKAAYNTYDGRFWPERFGPYPLNESERSSRWSDDLTKVANRASKMAPIFTGMPALVGLGAWPVPTVDYKHGETRQTKALKAPKGTYVDRGDQQFCASGQYTEDGNFFVAKWWGQCK